MITDEEAPPIIVPTPPANNPKERKPRRKMMPAPIENVTEFDIAKYISDLPCGLSIGQASSQISKYRTAMLKAANEQEKLIIQDKKMLQLQLQDVL